jgi:hypothetical protein
MQHRDTQHRSAAFYAAAAVGVRSMLISTFSARAPRSESAIK